MTAPTLSICHPGRIIYPLRSSLCPSIDYGTIPFHTAEHGGLECLSDFSRAAFVIVVKKYLPVGDGPLKATPLSKPRHQRVSSYLPRCSDFSFHLYRALTLFMQLHRGATHPGRFHPTAGYLASSHEDANTRPLEPSCLSLRLLSPSTCYQGFQS